VCVCACARARAREVSVVYSIYLRREITRNCRDQGMNLGTPEYDAGV